MKTSSLQEARISLELVFKTLDIKKVVFVDDQYDLEEEDISKLIGACKVLKKDNKEDLNEIIPSVDFSKPKQVWKDKLKKEWNKWDIEKKSKILRKIVELNNDYDLLDLAYIPRVGELFEKLVDFNPIPPSKWDENKDEMIEKCSKENRMLVLFDKDLSNGKDGLVFLKELLDNQKDNDFIVCGLLTRTISDCNNELIFWKEKAKGKLRKDLFFPLSKKRLEDDSLFVQGIKLVAMNLQCSKIRNKLEKQIKDVTNDALEDIKKLDVLNFDKIVFRSSALEGTFELDTLLRLYYLFHRKKATESIRGNKELIDLTKKIRGLSSLSLVQKDSTEEEDSWKIQRLELYDDGDYLNTFHLPLDLGDIFETNNKRKYILVSRHCDLAVRDNGIRNTEEGVLIKLFEGKPQIFTDVMKSLNKKIGKLKNDIDDNDSLNTRLDEIIYYIEEFDNNYIPHLRYEVLNHFDENTGKEWYADFRKSYSVLLSQLDWCVYNDNGKLRYDNRKKIPNNLTPGWKKLFNDSEESLSKDKSGKYILPTISLRPLWGNKKPICGKIQFEYPLKRIGRLKQPYSSVLLSRFARYFSEYGFEHDITKYKKK